MVILRRAQMGCAGPDIQQYPQYPQYSKSTLWRGAKGARQMAYGRYERNGVGDVFTLNKSPRQSISYRERAPECEEGAGGEHVGPLALLSQLLEREVHARPQFRTSRRVSVREDTGEWGSICRAKVGEWGSYFCGAFEFEKTQARY